MDKPKDDAGYLEHLSKAMFSAGLNWRMIENKWAGFKKAFDNFSPSKVASYTEADVKRLMKDTGIVRNERKIRATIENAKAIRAIEKADGSFEKYLAKFGSDEKRLQKDLQVKFHHIGPSSARMFLWSAGHKLKATAEEKKWLKSHPGHHSD